MTTEGNTATRLDWERLGALFQRVHELAPEERRAFIERETACEPRLRDELVALLEADLNSTSPISRAVGSALLDVIQHQRNAMVGRVVGSYRLVSILGQGGTGTVYLGERADRQYSAQVAIKMVDTSSLQGGLGARFRAERQILANLNHPNIARLLDAGETETGQPYLVMEHVQGEPVDRYCDSRNLDLRKRLKLFAEICAAVQYAHQNLIVHRDIKPANILVTPDGVPKLLDFGIAKLLRPDDSGQMADLTRVNDRLLTPEYASPEQIIGGNVTTASDVYSLGVVLYQLMCGLRPYRVPTSSSQLELERSICLSDPDKPSVAVARGVQEGRFPMAAIAEARCLSVGRLQRALAGDIDAIAMRALRKEPQHRYGSVEQLAADIRRYLSNEPVQARQGNWLYYTQRFARRHTAGVAAGLGFFAFVVGVAIVMSVQRQQIAAALEQATQDQRRAETVSEFMLNVFKAADPLVTSGKEPTARVLLEQAANRIQTDLNQHPQVRARLLEAIGGSYQRMGYPEKAINLLEEALQLARQDSTNSVKIGSILTELAIAQRDVARYEDSDRTFAEALRVLQRSDEPKSEENAKVLVDLARLEMLRSNVTQAEEHLTSALTLMKRFRGPDDPEVGAILSDLANVYLWNNDLARAEKTIREAARVYGRVPETHPDRIHAESSLARILMYANRLDEAAVLFERALSAQKFVYGAESIAAADTLASLGQLRQAQRDYATAERLIREALQIYATNESTNVVKIGYLQTSLATVLLNTGSLHEVESLLRHSLDLYASSLPPDHQYIASTEHYLGEALLGSGQLPDAEAVLTASMNRWKRTDAPAWRVARSKNALGEVLYRQGRYAEAEQYLTSTFRELSLDEGADIDAKRKARARIEQFYQSRGEREKLAALLRDVNAAVANNHK